MTSGEEKRHPEVHSAAQLQLADGALALVRQLHDGGQAIAAVEHRETAWSQVSRAFEKARRNRRRIHRYPVDFWRAIREIRGAAHRDAVQVEALTEARRHDEAIALAAALLPARNTDTEFLAAAGRAFARAGALSLQARAIAARRLCADSPVLQRQERSLLGRIAETEEGWLPRVRAPDSPADPAPGRVLHLLKASMPYRQSGYTMRSQYVIDGQRKTGYDPVVLTALGFPGQIGFDDAPASELIHETTHFHLNGASPDRLKGPPDLYLDAFASAATKTVSGCRPALIHAHSGHRGYELALVGLALATAYRLPFVYEVRGFFESMWSRDLEWNEQGELFARRCSVEARCMNAADAVVTLSDSMRAEIVSRGVPEDKVFVVPNAVDTDIFHPGGPPISLIEKLGLEDKFVFGYVSNLDHFREGHEVLIRATAALRDRGIPAVALIVGDGARRQELEALAVDEGVADSVIFTGVVPHGEVLDYYRALDVFVVPRVAERAARLVTPLKPFEAMAAGVPVVVSDLDALLEVTAHGERGLAFRAGDSESLAEALGRLQSNAGLRDELAQRGRNWVLEERQWEAVSGRYAAIYSQLGVGRAPA